MRNGHREGPSPTSFVASEEGLARFQSDLENLARIFAVHEALNDEQLGAILRAKAAVARGVELLQRLSGAGEGQPSLTPD